MSATAIPQLQTAMYAALTAAGTVTSKVTGVFDAVPPNQPRPYVALGDFTELPNKTFGNNGHELTGTLHIYDQDGVAFNGVAAKGNARSAAILEAVITALEAMPSDAVQGHVLVDCEYEFGEPMREPDDNGGMYRHIPARFRVKLEDAG